MNQHVSVKDENVTYLRHSNFSRTLLSSPTITLNNSAQHNCNIICWTWGIALKYLIILFTNSAMVNPKRKSKLMVITKQKIVCYINFFVVKIFSWVQATHKNVFSNIFHNEIILNENFPHYGISFFLSNTLCFFKTCITEVFHDSIFIGMISSFTCTLVSLGNKYIPCKSLALQIGQLYNHNVLLQKIFLHLIPLPFPIVFLRKSCRIL